MRATLRNYLAHVGLSLNASKCELYGPIEPVENFGRVQMVAARDPNQLWCPIHFANKLAKQSTALTGGSSKHQRPMQPSG